MLTIAALSRPLGASVRISWTEYVGSRWYRAPEMLAGSTDYGAAVDVWACACLAAEMSSGRPLFPGEDEGELVSCGLDLCALSRVGSRVTKVLSALPRFVFFPSLSSPLPSQSSSLRVSFSLSPPFSRSLPYFALRSRSPLPPFVCL